MIKVVTGSQAPPLSPQFVDVTVEVEYPVETVYVMISTTTVVLTHLGSPPQLKMVKTSLEVMVENISPEAVAEGGVSTGDVVVTMLHFKLVFVRYPCS
jgi:hypothetical protein